MRTVQWDQRTSARRAASPWPWFQEEAGPDVASSTSGVSVSPVYPLARKPGNSSQSRNAVLVDTSRPMLHHPTPDYHPDLPGVHDLPRGRPHPRTAHHSAHTCFIGRRGPRLGAVRGSRGGSWGGQAGAGGPGGGGGMRDVWRQVDAVDVTR